MEIIILKDIPFSPDLEMLQKFLCITDKSMLKRFSIMAEDALSIAEPAAAYGKAPVDRAEEHEIVIGGISMKSGILRENIGESTHVFPFITTCGTSINEWAQGYTGILEQFWANAFKQAALQDAVSMVHHHLESSFNPGRVGMMNPGSLTDWPLVEQGKLFRLLESAAGEIGVTLTESCMLNPVQSVSGIIFPSETGFLNCQLCPREDYTHRRAEFDQGLLLSKYSSGE
jgi:hypothetical protein